MAKYKEATISGEINEINRINISTTIDKSRILIFNGQHETVIGIHFKTTSNSDKFQRALNLMHFYDARYDTTNVEAKLWWINKNDLDECLEELQNIFNDTQVNIPEPKAKITPTPATKIKGVCLTTGNVIIYNGENDKKQMIADGFNPGHIKLACLKAYAKHKGYKWEYIED